MSLYKAYEAIKKAYQDTGKVNQIWFSEPLDNMRQNVYPAVYIGIDPAQFDLPVVTLNFTIEVVDIIDWPKEGIREQEANANDYPDNILDVLASTMNIHTQAMNILGRGEAWEQLVKFTPGTSLSPIIREGKNTLGGWSASLSVQIPSYGPIC